MAGASESVLCGLLRGDAAWRPPAGLWDGDGLLESAVEHRVHALLAARVDRDPPVECPARVRALLQEAVRREALIEGVQTASLRAILGALAAAGVHPILLKGVPLAYTCYDEPYHRPRNDLDLMIRKADAPIVRRVMEGAGHRRSASISGERVTHQFQYARQYSAGVVVEYDFHWRLANPALFAGLLSYEDLARDAVAIPALGDQGRGPGPVHALFVACVHRVAHHFDESHLLWLYDIHLVAERLTTDEWREFDRLTSRTATRAICARGLARAEEAFGTRVPPGIAAASATAGWEPSSAFLDGTIRRLDVELSNFKRSVGWRARGQFVRQHLFPEPAYILQTYGVRSRLWLPALYAHRIVRGAVRWLRPLARRNPVPATAVK